MEVEDRNGETEVLEERRLLRVELRSFGEEKEHIQSRARELKRTGAPQNAKNEAVARTFKMRAHKPGFKKGRFPCIFPREIFLQTGAFLGQISSYYPP